VVEQGTHKPLVVGSNPTLATPQGFLVRGFLHLLDIEILADPLRVILQVLMGAVICLTFLRITRHTQVDPRW
jgi:hypothetical protein